MTRLLVLGDATARSIATAHAQLVMAELALRAAADSEALTQVSIAALEKHRLRVYAAAQALEIAFMGREPSAPFPSRQEPDRWLRWLDVQGQGGGARAARPQTRASATRVADNGSIEP